MTRLSLDVVEERFPLAQPFRISGHVFVDCDVVVVTLSAGGQSGRGEASGVYYLDDDASNIRAAIEGVRAEVERGVTREELQKLLPAGGARNALDCALWELDARRTGSPVWEMAGLAQPQPLLTTFTLGADSPEEMARKALGFADARALKLKLTGDVERDISRVGTVRAARQECWMAVDGNQGFTLEALDRLMPTLVKADVRLVEQPLPRGFEAELEHYRSPIPIAADESVLTAAEVPQLCERFDIVNIKLDKSGGLTEALAMAAAARSLGLGVMVGNMVGSSLAMAPAFVLGQLCDIVDLDGPTFLSHDRRPAVVYRDGYIFCDETVWGRK